MRTCPPCSHLSHFLRHRRRAAPLPPSLSSSHSARSYSRFNPYYAWILLASQMWAITCLVLFFEATFEWIKPLRPFLKFVSVKGLVFFTWMQMEFIGCEERSRRPGRAASAQETAARAHCASGRVDARRARGAGVPRCARDAEPDEHRATLSCAPRYAQSLMTMAISTHTKNSAPTRWARACRCVRVRGERGRARTRVRAA
jgi:hypothetical protein